MDHSFRNPLPGVPDVESPFFHQLFSDRTGEVKRIANDLHENGFAVFEFPQPDIGRVSTAIIDSLSPMVDLEGFRASRTDNLRVQDAWKAVPEVRRLACNRAVIDLLTTLYGRPAFPFQTLDFAAGGQQHPHTDSVHFSSIPERYMCGVWLALEDISDDAGPLIYYPGSHKLPIYVNEHIGQLLSKDIYSADQTWYEHAWRELVRVHGLKEARFTPRRGQALIWAANLLHGGARHENRSRTRWSQVTHYYFEGCSYYTPMWSDPGFGRTYYRRPINLLTGAYQPHTYLSAPVPWQVTGPWGECPMPGTLRQVLHLTVPRVIRPVAVGRAKGSVPARKARTRLGEIGSGWTNDPRGGNAMTQHPAESRSDHIALDCAGMDFHAADRGLRDLLAIYLPADVRATLDPHFARLGQLAGGRLDALARVADQHPPVLHPRDRFGRDEDWIEYHPAYREMEAIAFGDFQFHAMSHRAGVLGMDAPLPPVAKYAFQYLFVQAEFGLMCPISLADSSNHVIRRFASEALRSYLLPRMLSADPSTLWKGTQFMTEKAGGSDVGAIESVARRDGDDWRLYGDKWFCSHTDGDVALVLARPEGAQAGTRGLSLFAMPRVTRAGRRNAYRIVRLKDKLGTRSMASGEIKLEGAEAYLVGEEGAGLKQMMQQVNLSRLSHGFRAAAMMRRCLNEALAAARGRVAFGRPVADFPLMRRQLLKMLVPTEQALSMAFATADAMGRGAADELRVLTGLLKLRACRDNVAVATAAMEARGGNGYIEDWVNPRLIRDAQVGLLWEGTSNINAQDVIGRAVGRDGAHRALRALLARRLDAAPLPEAFRAALGTALDRAAEAAERATGQDALVREAASALYNVASAVLLAWEATRPGADARRALIARCVLAHRLAPRDPLCPEEAAWERAAAAMLLEDRPLTMGQVGEALV